MIQIPADALVVGFGGNVGVDEAIIERFSQARAALGQAFHHLGDVRSAPLYRTAPIGPQQAAFLNSAVRVQVSDATPAQIIETVLEIERLLGRDRHVEARWGPRTIDLDVLVWGMRELHQEGPPPLEVPHPRLIERRFALQPLIDLLGAAVRIPRAPTAGELVALLSDQAIEWVAEAW